MTLSSISSASPRVMDSAARWRQWSGANSSLFGITPPRWVSPARPDDLRNHALWLIYRPECDRFGGCWRVNAQAATASTDDRRMTRTYLKIASHRGRAISVG